MTEALAATQLVAETLEAKPPVFGDFVARVCNHEGKLLTILSLAEQTRPLTYTYLHKALTDPQRDYEETWTPGPSSAGQWSDDCLEPAGCVHTEEVPARGGYAKGYKLTEYGKNMGVAAAGLLLDWSLRYPNISLQDLLGGTNSSGGLRAADTRLRILWEAVTSPEADSLSISGVFDGNILEPWDTPEYKRERTRIAHSIDALKLAGIIHAEDIEFDDDRAFVINDPTRPNNLSKAEHDVVNALYDVIQAAYEKHEDGEAPPVMTLDEAINSVTKQLAVNGDVVDPARVRQVVKKAYWHPHSVKGVQKVSLFNGGALTRFSLLDEHIDAVCDLLGILSAIELQEPKTVACGMELAQDIAHDPQKRALIMGKAYQFSPYAKKKRMAQTGNEIEALLQATGEVSLEEITVAYRALAGRNIQEDAVRAVLLNLAKQKRVAVTASTNPAKPGYGIIRNLYRVAERESD